MVVARQSAITWYRQQCRRTRIGYGGICSQSLTSKKRSSLFAMFNQHQALIVNDSRPLAKQPLQALELTILQYLVNINQHQPAICETTCLNRH